MRIAISSDLYFPMTNGVAVFAHNLARGLVLRGHDVLVRCPSMTHHGSGHISKKEGMTTVYLRSRRFPLYPDQIEKLPEKKRIFYKNGIWFSMHPYEEVKGALDKFKPEVIHNQTAEFIAGAVMKYAKKNNIPVVSTGHAYPDNITGQIPVIKPFKKAVDKFLINYFASFLKKSEYATVPTELALQDLVPKDIKVPAEAVSNGVDISEFSPGKPSEKVMKKYGIDTTRPTALYVGRVDHEKSIEHVVAAFEKVVKKIPEARLVIVGDGVAKAALEKQAREAGLSDSVQFLGKIMPPLLYDVYRAGNVFVTASETETQGIVLIEAAASGLPLIAVDKGAVKEICQNKRNGVLCEAGNVGQIARAMIKILADKKLQKEYSKESLKIAETHDFQKSLDKFIEIYQEAIRLKSQQ